MTLVSACGPTAGAPGTASSGPGHVSSARLWIGGDVFLGAGGHGALASIPAIVGGTPGIVNLEGPVGEDAGDRAGPDRSIRLIHARGALAELRTAGVVVAGIANNHARDAGADGGAATARALATAGVLATGAP